MSETLPTSPPPPPVVAVGPSTIAGGGLTVTLLVAAILDAIFGDNIDADTRLLIAGGIATALVTIGGRMLQAGLARIGEGSKRPAAVSVDVPVKLDGRRVEAELARDPELELVAAEERESAQAIADDTQHVPPDTGDADTAAADAPPTLEGK